MAAPEALEAPERVPQTPAALHPAPDSAQVTPLLWLSLLTLAVNGCIDPTCTVAAVGKTLTAMAGVVTGGVGVGVGVRLTLPTQPASRRATAGQESAPARGKAKIERCTFISASEGPRIEDDRAVCTTWV